MRKKTKQSKSKKKKDLKWTESTIHNASYHKQEETAEEEDAVGWVKRRYMPDGYPDFEPMPELGIPHYCYTMEMVIKYYLEGTTYTVCDFVEGGVDHNGHPIKKKWKMCNYK